MTFPVVECAVFAGVICRRFVLWRIVYSIRVLPFRCWFFRSSVLFGDVIFVCAVLFLQGCDLLFVGSMKLDVGHRLMRLVPVLPSLP